MKTKYLIWLVFTTITMNVSALGVAKNTVVNIDKYTQVKLTNLDLQNSGILFGDTASLVILSNSRESKITGQNFHLFSLRIAGNVVCDVPELSLGGDIIMQSGVFSIGTNKLIVYGDLLGENEKTYITASTGTIEKWMGHLPLGRQINVLGLEFMPFNDVYDICISRSHNPAVRSSVSGNYQSANRMYGFSKETSITNVKSVALPHEATHITKQIVFVENLGEWKKVTNPNHGFWNATRVSIFAPDDLHFPKIITPNDATNNVFKITGLEEYPNARLVVISKEGKILYDISSYKNDFAGKNLPDGTYYYIFSEEQNSVPIKKSYFEIVR